jgi:hypothetical protein
MATFSDLQHDARGETTCERTAGPTEADRTFVGGSCSGSASASLPKRSMVSCDVPNPKEIDRRFTYHAPTDVTKPMHEDVDALTRELAHKLDELLPEGREKSLALAHLQDCRMWSNAAIATSEPEK